MVVTCMTDRSSSVASDIDDHVRHSMPLNRGRPPHQLPDAAGKVVVRRKLQRSEMIDFFAELPPCLVGVEACATAHHSARLIAKAGHEVRLIPPSYVKPYVRRSKTDAADAEAM